MLIWAICAYIVRFLVVLVIEPTVNPIKHFPVVTIAAKLVLPLVVYLETNVAQQLEGWDLWLARGLIVGGILVALPGFCGFLVWELKESWRLYEANRPETLRPVLIGDHGEATAGFTRPCSLDGGVQSQQVGLLGDRADHFQHRTDLLAVLRQPLDLGHGGAHVGGQGVDALGGAVDYRKAFAGCLISIAGGLGGLGCAAGNVLSRGAHFMGCGGDLVDLA